MKETWAGPYRIHEKKEKGLYRLSKDGKVLKKSFHGTRLKPFNIRYVTREESTVEKVLRPPSVDTPVTTTNDRPSRSPSPPTCPEDTDVVLTEMPSPIQRLKRMIEEDTSEDEASEDEASETKSWLPDYGLTMSHKDMILDGCLLADDVIDTSQKLLKRQFAGIGGLQSTLLSQTNMMQATHADSVQIHHCPRKQHWLTSASSGKKVLLFDSSPGNLSSSVQVQLAQIYKRYRTDHKLEVEVVDVQRQRGGSDCGLFAIACAVSVAFGELPQSVKFLQAEMRPHLVSCLEKEMFSPFPRTAGKRKPKKSRRVQIKLFCRCHLPEEYDDMVWCDNCETWFHYECEGFDGNCKGTYNCQDCRCR